MSKGVELRLFLGLALLAATPSGASAQCLLCGAGESPKSTAGRGGQTPLHVEVETQLDMGRVAAGSGGGEVAIDPVTGVRRVSGDVRDLGGFALTGVVTVRGEPGAEVRVFLPATVESCYIVPQVTFPAAGTTAWSYRFKAGRPVMPCFHDLPPTQRSWRTWASSFLPCLARRSPFVGDGSPSRICLRPPGAFWSNAPIGPARSPPGKNASAIKPCSPASNQADWSRS